MLTISCGTKEPRETQISEEEKKVLFTVKDLIEQGYKFDEPSPNSEKFNKRVFEDGYELMYEYEAPKSALVKFIAINTSLRAYDSEIEAQLEYFDFLKDSFLRGAVWENTKQREKTDVQIEGDNTRILEFRSEETNMVEGYLLINRISNKVYLTFFFTLLAEKVDVWSSILPDKMAKVRNLDEGSFANE
jgi:hypothetical protein